MSPIEFPDPALSGSKTVCKMLQSFLSKKKHKDEVQFVIIERKFVINRLRNGPKNYPFFKNHLFVYLLHKNKKIGMRKKIKVSFFLLTFS